MKSFNTILFFLCVFAGFMTPMELGDVWWHLSTGEWILENMALPDHDPFTIASDSLRDNSFVLKGFWLSQIIFHLIERFTGLEGLILFKSALFTVASIVLWQGARRQGASRILACVSLVPAVLIFTFYDETRPQTFSIVFTAITLLVLENARCQGQRFRLGEKLDKPDTRAPEKPWFLVLIPVMLIWANMHPGFVVGLAFISLYASEHLITSSISKTSKTNRLFLTACALSILVSALNPNTLEAVFRTISMLNLSASGSVTIHEHLGVAQFVERTGDTSLMVSFVALAAGGAGSFILKRRRLDLLHLSIFCLLGGMSLITFRAGLFFAIASAPIIGYNLSGLKLPLTPALTTMGNVLTGTKGDAGETSSSTYSFTFGWTAPTAILLILASAFFLSTRSFAARGVLSPGIFPEKAAAYIEQTSPAGNLYHPYEWGGYLIWRLYPRHKVFIDGRALIPLPEHFEVQNAGPRWAEILREKDVSTVLFWPILPFGKRVPRIVFALAGDPAWRAVHWDTRSLVFVRKEFARTPLNKSAVWELLRSLVFQGISNNPMDAENYIALGEIFIHQRLPGQARKAFGKALSLDPDNQEASKWLRLL